MEIQLNNSNNNPFYGLRNCINIFEKGANSTIVYSELDKC